MITENVDCEVLGFDPEPEIKSFIAKVVDKLYYSAPSDSGIKIVVRQSQGLVKASCRIVSQVGTFVAEARGKNPIQTIQSVENKIKQQLDLWKANRFENA